MKPPKLVLGRDHPLWDDGVGLLALLSMLMQYDDVSDFDPSVIPDVCWVAMDDDGDWYGYVSRPVTRDNRFTCDEFAEQDCSDDYTFLTDKVRTTVPWQDTLTEVIRELKET